MQRFQILEVVKPSVVDTLFHAMESWCGYIEDEELRKWWAAYPLSSDDSSYDLLKWGGFAGIQFDKDRPGVAVLTPCEVKTEYRGNGLQRQFIERREAWARQAGYKTLLSLTYCDNLPSANNLISRGFKLTKPWLGCNGKCLYWRKDI